MKRVLLLMLAVLAISPITWAGDKKKASAKADDNEIHWLTLDEVQQKMKKEPRKVYVDVYTGWCGWCKVMDKKTFSNPEVIKYINKNFYAVKLDAEQKDSISFVGKKFGFSPDYRANLLAVELMRGQMSYPTTVILEENFQNPQPIPGYLEVPIMEKILKYFGENHFKTTKFEEYDKNFVPSWAVAPKAD